MSIKVNKNVTIQGGLDVALGSIIKVDIKSSHLKNEDDKYNQLIYLTYYRDSGSAGIEAMPTPKEFGYDRFNIELTSEELTGLSMAMIHNKAIEYLVNNNSGGFVNADFKIV